jgi:hypothetical protein
MGSIKLILAIACTIGVFVFATSFVIHPPKVKDTLIFVDKTQSAALNKETQATYNAKLDKLIKERYDVKNATLKGFYIHGNTLGAGSFYESAFPLTAPDVSGIGQLKAKVLTNNYQKEKLKKQEEISQAIKKHIEKKNEGTSRSKTDVWGALQLISNHYAKRQNTDRKVVFLSDMMESMPGKGRRDFHKKAPKDKAEAEQLAVADLKWIKQNLDVNPGIFAGLRIEVWPPADAMQGGQYQYIEYYWKKMFAELKANFEWVK